MSTATLPPYGGIGRRDHDRNVPRGPDSNSCRGLVKSNLQNCVSISICKDSETVQFDQILLGDSNFCNAQSGKVSQASKAASRREAEPLDEWAARKAREMITSIESQHITDDAAHRPESKDSGYVLLENSASNSDAPAEIPNMRASTLVQMWRDLEAETGASRTIIRPCSATSSISPKTVSINGSLEEEPSGECEASDSADDRSTGWESDAVETPVETPTSRGVSNVGDRQKVRVADVIKRFTSGSTKGGFSVFSEEVDMKDQSPRFENGSAGLLDHCFSNSKELVGLNINGNANYRRIRGTQSLKNFLMRLEGERQRELAGLGERHAVSQFSHRGRIQSLLRFRFLSREVTVKGRQNPPSTSVELNQLQSGTSVLLLRQRFNTTGQPNAGQILGTESNNSTEQDANMEDTDKPSYNTRNIDSSSDLKKEEPIKIQKIEPQLPCSLPSARQELKEEAHPSTGEESGGKSSCIGLVTYSLDNANHTNEVLDSNNSRGGKQEPQLPCSLPSTRQELKEEAHPSTSEESGGKSSCIGLVTRQDNADITIEVLDSNNSRGGKQEPQLPCSLPSTRQELKEEAHSSTSEESGGKSSCIGLVTYRQDNSNNTNEVLDLNNSRGGKQLGSEIRKQEIAPQLSCKPSTTGVLKEEATPSSKRKQVEKGSSTVQFIWQRERNYNAYYALNPDNSSNRLVRESYQQEKPITTLQELEPQFSCPLESLPSRIQDFTEGASPSSDAESRESSLCIDQINWHENANNSTTIQSWVGDAEEEETETGQVEGHGDDFSLIYPPPQMQEQGFRRQPMYDDLLEKISDNVELRQLYERRSVSTALSSDFRVRMDQLVLSMLGRQEQEQTEESMTEEDEEHLIQNYEINNGNLVPSESEQLPLRHLRHFHDQDNSPEQSPVERHLPNQSLEMNLIFELRGDIGRIHQEVSDLKRSLRNCMDIQLELQRCIKQGAPLGTYQTDSILNSQQQLTKRGNCCICYEMQVDSLLYRCGHMCACFKCAYELQWSSGKCPICRASIVDVVRTFSDSS